MKTSSALLVIAMAMLMLASSMFAVQGVALGDVEAELEDGEPLMMKRFFSRQNRDRSSSNSRLNRYMRRLLARQNYQAYRDGSNQIADM